MATGRRDPRGSGSGTRSARAREKSAAAEAAEAALDVRRVIDALPAVIGYWDREMRNVVANRAYLDFFGVMPDADHPLTIEELIGPELFPTVRPYVERVLEGERQEFDRTLIDPEGNTRFTHASYIPDVVDGEVRGFSVLVSDITPRRLAERARRRAEARFKLAFSASPVPMVLFDSDGLVIEINAAMCELLGYDEIELCGRPMEAVVTPVHRERERARIVKLLSEQPESTSVELQLVHKDGSPIWVLVSLALAEGEHEEGRLGIAHVQNISARKRAEGELRLSRARLNEAEQMAQMGSWEVDLRNDRITWSAGLFRLFGLRPEQFDARLDRGMGRVYPDDRELVRETIARTVSERSSFAIEYRALRADGRVRTMRSRGEVIVDENGEPVRLIGVAHDITEAKLAQDGLRTSSIDLDQRELELQKVSLRDAPERQVELRAPLTPRQLEILRLIAQGKTSAEIAEELIIAEGTVKWHVKHILAKTASSSRAEAVARVLGTGA
jgi:PAS domain S-box-containing protein